MSVVLPKKYILLVFPKPKFCVWDTQLFHQISSGKKGWSMKYDGYCQICLNVLGTCKSNYNNICLIYFLSCNLYRFKYPHSPVNGFQSRYDNHKFNARRWGVLELFEYFYFACGGFSPDWRITLTNRTDSFSVLQIIYFLIQNNLQ